METSHTLSQRWEMLATRWKVFAAVGGLGVLNVAIWLWARPRDEAVEAGADARTGQTALARLEGTGAGKNATGFFGVILNGESILLEPKAEGRILQVFVKSGETVKKGTVIAQLDKNVREQELKSAQSAMRDAARRYNRRAALSRGAEATVSAEELDAARVRLTEEKARLEIVKTALAETRIVAPFDGTVVETFLAAGALTGPGRPVARLAGQGDLRVRFAVPEDQGAEVTPGMKLDVEVPSLLFDIPGQIVGVNPEIDTASRMIYAVASLDVPAEERGRLTTGLVARVRPHEGPPGIEVLGETGRAPDVAAAVAPAARAAASESARTARTRRGSRSGTRLERRTGEARTGKGAEGGQETVKPKGPVPLW
jgi:RND family efflux transporter MFP subunit